MATPLTLLGDHVVFVGETFTADITNVYVPSSGKRLVISGWDLTIHGNTGIVNAGIRLGSTTHAQSNFPVYPTVANGNNNRWCVLGVRISGGVDEVLKLMGGGTLCAVTGTIFVTEV